eukprot:TRINITY_DN5022_c0_g1_i1.p1 TRINITY_DN5022_c0_g1~~TRINITY_DN5022_c0_g1_i1.p1  ORF type:complete len:385 (-),score=86.25 TRINITY_DN5022_c0_g1_i1:256-1410(-)
MGHYNAVQQFLIDQLSTLQKDWKGGACKRFGWIFFFFFMSPFILEGTSILLVLGIFMPVGFFFGMLEHHAPFIWAVYVFIVNLGGLGDLVADLTLCGRLVIFQFTHVDVGESGELSPMENQLFLWRLILTLVGGLGGIMLMVRKGFKFQGGSAIAGLFAIILWKLVMVGCRFFILYLILAAIFRKRKIPHEVQGKIQVFEAILLLDVLWSAIPLGVLTFLEMAVYSEGDFKSDFSHGFEVFKLCCVAIDIAGITHLFYWTILDLERWCRPAGHKDHHDHHDVEKGHVQSEKKHLLTPDGPTSDDTSPPIKPATKKSTTSPPPNVKTSQTAPITKTSQAPSKSATPAKAPQAASKSAASPAKTSQAPSKTTSAPTAKASQAPSNT